MKSLLSLAVAMTCSGCLSESALDYDRLHISATADGGTVSTSPQDGCIELPVLLGSRAQSTVRVANQIDVEVDATRDRVKLEIDSVKSPVSRTLRADDLASSSFAEDIPVETLGGDSFVIRLRGTCTITPDSG